MRNDFTGVILTPVDTLQSIFSKIRAARNLSIPLKTAFLFAIDQPAPLAT